jgi:cytochrome c
MSMLKTVTASAIAALILAGAGSASAADVAHGKKLFQDRCGMCHTGAADDGDGGQAPALAGVVGRKAGGAPDFAYTPALKSYGKSWTTASLDTFLAGPGKLVPGTAMPVAVPNAKDRADLVAYLATLKK